MFIQKLMGLKETFIKIFPIKEYTKLKQENPIGFYLTILIPVFLLSIFLYLYLYPLGYNREYIFNNKEILESTKGNIYFSGLEKEKDGVTLLTYDPFLPVRNPNIRLSVKGEGVFVLPIKEKFSNMRDIWEYSTTKFKKENIYGQKEYLEEEYGEYVYGYVDEYEPEDLGLYSFYIKYLPSHTFEDDIYGNPLLPKDNQLLFKYKNMRVIQHAYLIELRVDNVYDGTLFTYQTYLPFRREDYNREHELIAVYKEAEGGENGYIELLLDGKRSHRVPVSSPYNIFYDYDEVKKYEVDITSEVIEDLNQKLMSVGQELYRVNMEKVLPREARDAIDIKIYYEDVYKDALPIKHNGDIHIPLSAYYDKNFYNYFKGNILQLRVGYQYPFDRTKKLSDLYGITPFTVRIAGQRENIEEVKILIEREPIWQKLRDL